MEILDFISQAPVIWFLIGLGFLLLEFMLPSLIVLFFGIGSWITALGCFTIGLDVNEQIIFFVTSSVLSLLLLRKYFKKMFVGKGEEGKDEADEEFIDKKAVAETSFDKSKRGKVIFKGTSWDAESDDKIISGEMVKIVSKESIMKVKPIS